MLRTPLMRRRRIVAGALALAIPTAIFATATSASAYAPTPGAAEIILEAGSLTGAGANALPSGWWGHEGSAHSQSTYFSINTTGSTLAATLAKIGPDATSGNLHTAFVVNPTAGNVKPAIAAGETVGQAYQWFDASGFGHSLAGNTQQNDYVDAISTEASYNAWFNAGQPVYGFDNNLNAIDAAAPGAPLSGGHAIGKSILNNWPAGTQIGVVYYVSNANNANNEPVVLADSTGHAEAAYVPLTTVALPSDHSQDPAAGMPASYDSLRTSAGFIDTTVGDRTAATAVSSNLTSPQSSGTSVTFSTTVTDTDNANAPVTAGSVTFYDGSTAIGTASTATAAGVWSLPVGTLAPGGHTIIAVYNGPATGTHFAQSNAAGESFTISAANTTTVLTLNPDATNSTVTVHAGDAVTLTAHAFKTGDSAMTAVAGKVTFNGFYNGSTSATVLGSSIATDGSGVATLSTSFAAAGNWTVQAVFTPTDTTNFQGSNYSTPSFAIAPSANPTATGNVTADIPAGTLSIQTPYDTSHPLNVGTLAPNTDPTTGYTGSTTFGNIAITDTRAGDLPWTLTAQSSNLTGGTDGQGVINGENVGITGMTFTGPTNGAVNFTNWFAAPAAGATAVGTALEPSDTGSLGLAGTPAKTLAHTAHGVGSWNFGGTLTVVAPADTEAGHYAGTVTFTVLSQ